MSQLTSTTAYVKSPAETWSETDVFRHSARIIHRIVQLNADGLTQADSLIQPEPAGNCLNWIVGHLLLVDGLTLQLVGERPVMPEDALKRYDRGALPLKDGREAKELSELMAAWDESAERLDMGLADLAPKALDVPAPFSPVNDPNETVRSLLNTLLFHQAYHAGQTAILRRMAGKERVLG